MGALTTRLFEWIRLRPGAVLAGIALVLYLPGLGWGLPEYTSRHVWGPDELAPIDPVGELYGMFFVENAPINPQYPLLPYVTQALFQAPYLGWLKLSGGLGDASNLYPYGLTDPASSLQKLAILARLPSLLMGAGCVFLSCLTAGELWGVRFGAAAAAAALVNYPMFYYARTSNVDLEALFWCAAGLWIASRIVKRGMTRNSGIALATTAALATASKDPSYAVFAAIAVIVLARHFRDREPGRLPDLKLPMLALVSFLAIYAFASGLALHPDRYAQHLDFIRHGGQARAPDGSVYPSHFYGSLPASPAGYTRLIDEAIHHLADSLGVPLLIIAAIGLIAAPAGTRIFALPCLAVFLGILVPVRFAELRFLLVPSYVLTLFAGYGLGRLLEPSPAHARRPRPAAVVIVALALGFGAVRGGDLTFQMLNDSRYTAAAWLAERTRAGDRLGYYGSPLKLPALANGVFAGPGPGRVELVGAEPNLVDPELILVIPQQAHEPVHEWDLPETEFRALVDGTRGYRQVLHLVPRTLFKHRPVTFVNPPVRIFARQDLLPRFTNDL